MAELLQSKPLMVSTLSSGNTLPLEHRSVHSIGEYYDGSTRITGTLKRDLEDINQDGTSADQSKSTARIQS